MSDPPYELSERADRLQAYGDKSLYPADVITTAEASHEDFKGESKMASGTTSTTVSHAQKASIPENKFLDPESDSSPHTSTFPHIDPIGPAVSDNGLSTFEIPDADKKSPILHDDTPAVCSFMLWIYEHSNPSQGVAVVSVSAEPVALFDSGSSTFDLPPKVGAQVSLL